MQIAIRARSRAKIPIACLAAGLLAAAGSASAAEDLLTFVEAEPMPAILDVQATAVRVSPDGKNLYAVAGLGDAIVTFDRDAETGELTFSQTLQNGVGGVQGLEAVSGVVVSPDGKHVYTAATGNPGPSGVSGVAAFARDPVDGDLTFVEAEFNGVGGVVGLEGAHRVDVSPDGAHVYVAAASGDAVVVFARNATTGELSFVEAVVDGQNSVVGLNAVLSAVVSPDGSHVYTAAFADDAVAVFTRNPTTGELTFEQAIFDTDLGVDGLDGSSDITVSSDGANVYSVSLERGTDGENALVTFDRNATTGELTWEDAKFDGVDGVDGIAEATSVVLTPSGQFVFVTGFGDPAGTPGGSGDNALAGFRRLAATGVVGFSEAKFDGVDGVDGLEGARWVDVSPDGLFVYVAGATDAEVAVFAIREFEVPALGPWALGVLGSLLALAAAVALRRRLQSPRPGV